MAGVEIGIQSSSGNHMPLVRAELANSFVETALRNHAQFIWVVRCVTGCREDAEDIVQAAYLKAYSNLHQFRGEAQMSTWLRAIVHNAAREYVRNRGSRVFLSLEWQQAESGEPHRLELPDSRLTPEEACAQSELAALLSEELERLSSYSREAIRMCVLEETPHAEAAAMLDVSVGSMKSRIFRGKRHLHSALKRYVGCDGGLACN
jgi:RNA polymerase sigma-70 factor (ECF subfamily)